MQAKFYIFGMDLMVIEVGGNLTSNSRPLAPMGFSEQF